MALRPEAGTARWNWKEVIPPPLLPASFSGRGQCGSYRSERTEEEPSGRGEAGVGVGTVLYCHY